MRTLQTSIILNEILNSAKDKCSDTNKVLDTVKKELETIIDIGLIEFDYTSLDANKILAINETLYSMEEDLYELLATLKNISEDNKEDLLTFGQIG